MVKYLHDDALQNVTAALTDCPVGGRRLNARLEAYTMKRAGTDKKYAAELQSHHLQTQDVLDREWSAAVTTKQQQLQQRQRSVSTGDERGAAAALSSSKQSSGNRRKRSNSLDLPPAKTTSVAAPRSISAGAGINYLESAAMPSSHPPPSSLVVLNRRLWTDFILTLNQAFPDYDFAAATASDFHLIPLETAMARINERLSEVATLLLNSNHHSNAVHSQHASGGGSTNNNHSSSSSIMLTRSGITNLLPQLWAAVDATIHLQNDAVQVYEYEGDDDVLRNESNNGDVLWSFHYFFVNKQLKRILLFTCMETIDPQQQYGNGMNNSNGVAVDGMLPVVDYYDDDEEEEANTSAGSSRNLGMTPPPSKLQRRESDSAHSNTYGEDNRSEAPTVMEAMTEAAYYDRGDDDDSSSQCSVDFDLDPADAVSGGIPLDHV